MKNKKLNKIASVVGTTFAVSLTASPFASANENPFEISDLNSAFKIADKQEVDKCGSICGSKEKSGDANKCASECGNKCSNTCSEKCSTSCGEKCSNTCSEKCGSICASTDKK